MSLKRLFKRDGHKRKKERKVRIPRLEDFSYISPFSEGFSQLRTSLRFAKFDRKLQTILVTGAAPREGKSTVSLNLAKSLALSGQKTLLLEFDLRLPTFWTLFHKDPEQGISSILSGVFDTPVDEGDLSQIGISDLFFLIDIQEKTGALTIDSDGDQFVFSFVEGKLVASTWKGRPASKRLASLLVKAGKISPEQAKFVVKRSMESKQRPGFVLVNTGLVSPEDIKGPIRLQIMETIGEVLGLENGTYQFEKTSYAPLKHEVIDPLGISNTLANEFPALRACPFIQKEIATHIYPTETERLSVILSGEKPPNPSDVLVSQRTAKFLDILKNGFDFDVIVIDTPPVSSVSDACTLSAYADGVILVAQAGGVNRAIIRRTMDQLKKVNAPIIGFVLNQMDPSFERYYGYGYYSKYRDYYYKGGKRGKKRKS